MPLAADSCFDSIVIGAGAAGLSAALILGRARRRVIVFDDETPRNAPTPTAHSMLGHDGKSPAQIKEEALAQVLAYPTIEYRQETVTLATKEGDFFTVVAHGKTYRTCTLVVATGVRDLLPALPGIDQYWGKSVIHCPYCHGYEHAEVPTGYLANHDNCYGHVELVYHWTKKLTVFTDGSSQMSEEEIERLRRNGVPVFESPIAGLLGHNQQLQGVLLQDGTQVPLEALYVSPQQHRRHDFLQLDYEIVHTAFKDILSKGQTNVEGLYLAGDIARNYQQLVSAAYNGTVAGTAINGHLCKGVFK